MRPDVIIDSVPFLKLSIVALEQDRDLFHVFSRAAAVEEIVPWRTRDRMYSEPGIRDP
jgi:hypothetical protein